MKKKFYTCRYDRAFKEVFFKKSNEDLLKLLLEKTIEFKINDIIIHNNERNTGNVYIRRKVLDGVVGTNDKIIDIEINTIDVRVRNTAFLCNMYSSYTLVGDDYDENVKTIQINLSYGLKHNDLKRIYKIQTDNKDVFVKNFTIYEYNMDKIIKLWYNHDEEGIEKYKYLIMLALDREDLKKLARSDKMVEKYMKELEKVNSDPKFMMFMTHEQDEKMIRNTLKKRAKMAGEKRGEKRGEKKGIIKVAKEMLKNNTDINFISKCTGLSVKELKKIS